MGRNCAEATNALFRRKTRSVAALVAAVVRPTALLTADALPFPLATARECLAATVLEEAVLETAFRDALFFDSVEALLVVNVAVASAPAVWATTTCPAPKANANINPLLIDTLNSTSPTRHRKNRHNASINFICV